jgi:hypothetical protein
MKFSDAQQGQPQKRCISDKAQNKRQEFTFHYASVMYRFVPEVLSVQHKILLSGKCKNAVGDPATVATFSIDLKFFLALLTSPAEPTSSQFERKAVMAVGSASMFVR